MDTGYWSGATVVPPRVAAQFAAELQRLYKHNLALGRDENFVHEDPDGTTRVFVINTFARLAYRHWRLCDAYYIDLNEPFIEFVKTDRGIEPPKVERLKPPYLYWPILHVVMPDESTLTIDGHHRLVRLWQEGEHRAAAVRIPLQLWAPFQQEV